MASLNPLDLYDIRSELSEEEILIQDAVGRWVDERALPLMPACFDEARFPSELIPDVSLESLKRCGKQIPSTCLPLFLSRQAWRERDAGHMQDIGFVGRICVMVITDTHGRSQ